MKITEKTRDFNFHTMEEIIPLALERIKIEQAPEFQKEQKAYEKKLAGMTIRSFNMMLKRHGIVRNSESWNQYSQAKRIVFGDYRIQTPGLYDKLICWIKKYVGV